MNNGVLLRFVLSCVHQQKDISFYQVPTDKSRFQLSCCIIPISVVQLSVLFFAIFLLEIANCHHVLEQKPQIHLKTRFTPIKLGILWQAPDGANIDVPLSFKKT